LNLLNVELQKEAFQNQIFPNLKRVFYCGLAPSLSQVTTHPRLDFFTFFYKNQGNKILGFFWKMATCFSFSFFSETNLYSDWQTIKWRKKYLKNLPSTTTIFFVYK